MCIGSRFPEKRDDLSASNTGLPLTGTYKIYVGATDTGKVLKDGPPPKVASSTTIFIK